MSFITVTPESVQIWDTKGNLTQTFRDLSEKGVTTCALDDRDRKFILGDYDGNIKVYDYLSGADDENRLGPYDRSFPSDSPRIATVCYRKRLHRHRGQ